MHSQDNKTLNNVIHTLPNGDHYEGRFYNMNFRINQWSAKARIWSLSIFKR